MNFIDINAIIAAIIFKIYVRCPFWGVRYGWCFLSPFLNFLRKSFLYGRR